ncbi:MAG: iron-containing alcohol dehydrogenase [Erysipelotrichaceae bacterium]|jgi:alcohol dehydrogenase class IV
MTYSLRLPKCVYCGENSLGKIVDIIQEVGARRVALFIGKGFDKLGFTNMIVEEIAKAGANHYIFDELQSEPTYIAVQEVIDKFMEIDTDMIIACGGGSVMDAAKLASILRTKEYSVKDLLTNPLLAHKTLPLLCIPTTAGTGAEATPNAIVKVPEQELKIGIVNKDLISDYVILDPNMIKNLPRHIAASTGIDALCHAIECFTSKKATPFSNTFALAALDDILNNIENACDNKNAIEAKAKMQIASFYAGVAITASGTTAIHALSYPLGGKYGIAHGVSNAMLLVPVMEFNEPSIQGKLAEIYDYCYHGEDRLNEKEKKSEYMIGWLNKIVKHLEIPTNLKEFGIEENDLEELVESGMKVTRLLVNNMREVTSDDARMIYRRIIQ